MDEEMTEQERVLRDLTFAVTGIGGKGGIWTDYCQEGIRAEVMQADDDPDVILWLWNTDRDTETEDNEGFSILFGCAEVCNYPAWTPDVADAFKTVINYLHEARITQDGERHHNGITCPLCDRR